MGFQWACTRPLHQCTMFSANRSKSSVKTLKFQKYRDSAIFFPISYSLDYIRHIPSPVKGKMSIPD
jgi:hypothetical protein